MPVSEERLYKIDRLNRWFAISSILMTASLFWMIHVDYDRPWRGFQDRYFLGKAAIAHLHWLDAQRTERKQEIEDARQRLRDVEALSQQVDGVRRAALTEELVEVDLSFNLANGEWSRRIQLLDVSKSRYEEKLAEMGAEHPVVQDAHTVLAEEEDRVEELRQQKEKWEDKKADLQKQLKNLEAPVRNARKALRDLEAIADGALAKDRNYRGVLSDQGIFANVPFVSTLINAPLVDFTAPKNTPSRHQVNQLVLPNVRQRLNYLETYTTDRCTTCHVAIDDPEFSKERLARKLEQSLPGVNEALQRLGHEALEYPPAPTPEGADRALEAGRVTEHWDQLDAQQRDDYFDALLARVNEYLKLANRKTIDLTQPVLAHPDLDLFVSLDSPHPMVQIGCTVCHEGNPQETDFVQAAHSPATHQVRERWEEEYYITLLGVPNVTFETVEHYWDRPMRLPQYAESGCAKCHTEIADIARFKGEHKGARINLGQHLFTSVGCINCHEEDTIGKARRVGPDLTHVAAKLKPDFVQTWAHAPQDFRPSTRMPHFFMQENNRSESANTLDTHPVLRTETEVAAISKYLFAVSAPWNPIAKPQEVEGDARRGRELFRVAGCLSCHANLTEYGEVWITKDIANREGVDAQTARHRYLGMTPNERTRYAMKHFVNERDSFLDPEQAVFDPEAEYTTPIMTRFAPELTGVGSKVTIEWLYSWLMQPTHYSPETKMPSLRLAPEEAADLAAYLMTLKRDDFVQQEFELNAERLGMADDLIFTLLSTQRSERRSRAMMADEGGELSATLVSLLSSSESIADADALLRSLSQQDKKLVFLGSKMIGHYGCYACHSIPGFEKTTPPGTNLSAWAQKPVTQLDFAFYDHAFHHLREEKEEVYSFIYPRSAHELNDLSPIEDNALEQITHTHAAFAKHKMLNPRIWDREKIKGPYDKLKMPNFYFSEKEAEALTTYLLSRIPPRVDEAVMIKYDKTASGPIARGRKLTRELNCIACHQIEDNVPTIQQYFRHRIGDQIAFDSFNAPPLLWGEGAKVQHNWLHGFLQNAVTLRPWLQIRMPTFRLTSDERTTLVEYFAALSQEDSAKLSRSTSKVQEYIESVASTVERSARESEKGHTPGSDWYEQEALEDESVELRRWAVERKLIRPNEVDPLQAPEARVHAAHQRLLERISFIEGLYDVSYPFVEPPAPLSSREVFDRGSRFFNDMGCLKCHVLGDMLPGPAKTTDDFVQIYRLDGVRGEGDQAVAILNGVSYPVGSVIDGHTLIDASNTYNATGDVDTQAIVEGPSAGGTPERVLLVAASAPNLSLTYQRLRRAWVHAWMLEPQLIQPGTKMPKNFVDGVSPYVGDPDYPGTSADHIDMLVDFLYHAGAANTRVPLAKIVMSEEGAEFDEDGEEEEFDDE